MRPAVQPQCDTGPQRDVKVRWGIAALSFFGVLFGDTSRAFAHVKWFSQYDWSQPPLTVSELLTPTFWCLFALSIVVLMLFVVLDSRATATKRFKTVTNWFESRHDWSLLVMRIGAFAALLVAWQAGTLMTPELIVENIWIERLQLAIVLCLLLPNTTTLAGVGLFSLWGYGAVRFGFFHMLDYVNVLGVAYFLTVRPLKHEWLRASALPVLYGTVGFSLLWLAAEKLVYPQWSLYILEQNPILKLGLPSRFFLVSAAFVEAGLGFMLLMGLFGRSLSVTITLVFFLTTAVFGKVEIIGHTMIHATLVVFLLEGRGRTFKPPAELFKTLPMRIAFATIGFSTAFLSILFAYTAAASQRQAPRGHTHQRYELTAADEVPSVKLEVLPDPKSGWNVHIMTTNFTFAPESVGSADANNDGHVHLYLDGNKIARVYGPWHHLSALPTGTHTVRVTLNTNDHRDYSIDGQVIEATETVEVTATAGDSG